MLDSSQKAVDEKTKPRAWGDPGLLNCGLGRETRGGSDLAGSPLKHTELPQPVPLGQVSLLLASFSVLSCKMGTQLSRLRSLLLLHLLSAWWRKLLAHISPQRRSGTPWRLACAAWWTRNCPRLSMRC